MTTHIANGVAMKIRLLAVLALAATLTACSSSRGGNHSGNDAANFIGPLKQNAAAAAQDTDALLTETAAVIAAGDVADLYTVAADAKALHDHLADFRSQAMGAPGSYKTEQMEFVDAENELKNAAGSVLTWTGDPNPETSAQWQTQMGTAVHDWNAAVTQLWSAAGAGAAPTISIPGS